jgi:hypothetical protein
MQSFYCAPRFLYNRDILAWRLTYRKGMANVSPALTYSAFEAANDTWRGELCYQVSGSSRPFLDQRVDR